MGGEKYPPLPYPSPLAPTLLCFQIGKLVLKTKVFFLQAFATTKMPALQVIEQRNTQPKEKEKIWCSLLPTSSIFLVLWLGPCPVKNKKEIRIFFTWFKYTNTGFSPIITIMMPSHGKSLKHRFISYHDGDMRKK